LLTEGFDEPRVDCVIMARPTRSKLLYAQMVGRGTRLHPVKKDLMVIDVADNSKTHQLPGLHSLFNLPLNLNLNGGNALEIERDIERLNRTQPWIDAGSHVLKGLVWFCALARDQELRDCAPGSADDLLHPCFVFSEAQPGNVGSRE
jgi:hypothetical protein